jgi:hypothetical protein
MIDLAFMLRDVRMRRDAVEPVPIVSRHAAHRVRHSRP